MGKVAFFKTRDFFIIPLAYIGLGVVLTIFQNSLIYHPDTDIACPQLETYRIENTAIRGFYIENESAKQLIVVYHGNAGRACNRTYFIPFAEASDSSLLLVEYPGFGEKGRVSTRAILQYIPQVADFTSSLEYQTTTIIGESIGGAFASYHSKITDIDTAILISPFSSLHSMTRRIVPIYPTSLLLENTLPTSEWANHIEQLYILAATNDTVIPIEESIEVHSATTPNSTIYPFDEGDHNSIFGILAFRETLLDILVNTP